MYYKTLFCYKAIYIFILPTQFSLAFFTTDLAFCDESYMWAEMPLLPFITWDEKVILMKKNVPWPALGFFGTSWW